MNILKNDYYLIDIEKGSFSKNNLLTTFSYKFVIPNSKYTNDLRERLENKIVYLVCESYYITCNFKKNKIIGINVNECFYDKMEVEVIYRNHNYSILEQQEIITTRENKNNIIYCWDNVYDFYFSTTETRDCTLNNENISSRTYSYSI